MTHKYLIDERYYGGDFNFFRSLSKTDAQWYLYLSEHGYSFHPPEPNTKNKYDMAALSYAFFPLFPSMIFFTNLIFKNVELSAFILTNLIFVANIVSLYVLFQKIGEKKSIYFKTVLLLFFGPFSIFFRAAFTEGIMLLTIIWFIIFLSQKKYQLSAVFLGLNFVSKATFWPTLFYLLYVLIKTKQPLKKVFSSLVYCLIPLTLWMYTNYQKTGNLFYFYKVREFWNPILTHSFLQHLLSFPLYNLLVITQWLHTDLNFYSSFSKVDGLVFIFVCTILMKSQKKVDRKIWVVGCIAALFPPCVTILMSYTRYSLMVIPIYIYISKVLAPFWFTILFVLLFALSVICNILFVNGFFIG